jgi:hypothetical protein
LFSHLFLGFTLEVWGMNNKKITETSKGGERNNSKYDLEDRLVDFTCRMVDVLEALPNTRMGNYLAGQLVKSCHSPALNYGEAQAAESPADFIHKL